MEKRREVLSSLMFSSLMLKEMTPRSQRKTSLLVELTKRSLSFKKMSAVSEKGRERISNDTFSKVSALRKRNGEGKSLPFCTKKTLNFLSQICSYSHTLGLCSMCQVAANCTNLDHLYCCGKVFWAAQLQKLQYVSLPQSTFISATTAQTMYINLALSFCGSCYVTRALTFNCCLLSPPPSSIPPPYWLWYIIGTNTLKPVSSPLVKGNGLIILQLTERPPTQEPSRDNEMRKVCLC